MNRSIKDYGKVTQHRVMVGEEVTKFCLCIDGYKTYIPRELLAEVVYMLSQQLPPELETFNLLAEMTASHLQKCAAVASAEDG